MHQSIWPCSEEKFVFDFDSVPLWLPVDNLGINREHLRWEPNQRLGTIRLDPVLEYVVVIILCWVLSPLLLLSLLLLLVNDVDDDDDDDVLSSQAV